MQGKAYLKPTTKVIVAIKNALTLFTNKEKTQKRHQRKDKAKKGMINKYAYISSHTNAFFLKCIRTFFQTKFFFTLVNPEMDIRLSHKISFYKLNSLYL